MQAGWLAGWPRRWLAASVAGRFGGWPLRWLAASASVAGCLCACAVLVLCLCCACARAVVCLCRSCVRLCRCAVGMSALAKAAVSFEAAAVVATAAFAAINSRIFDRHWGAFSSRAARARAGGGWVGPVLFFCSTKGCLFFCSIKGPVHEGTCGASTHRDLRHHRHN